MGFIDKFVNKKNGMDKEFLEIVQANDKGEKWACDIIHRRWSEEPNFLTTLAEARIQLYSVKAQQGSEEAQYWLGVSQAQLGNKYESYKWLNGLANKGNAKAMMAIALEYSEYGIYGHDEEKEFEWKIKAAEAGAPDAQCAVALEYAIRENDNEALKWYAKAAQQSYSKGCLGYGKIINEMKGKYYHNYSKEKLEEMTDIIENSYLDAINLADNREDYSEAASSLGWFYKGTKDIKRAIYFFYRAYNADNDRQMDYKRALEMCKEYGIDINSIDEIGKELLSE